MKNEFIFVVFCLLNYNLLAQDSPTAIVSPTVSDSTIGKDSTVNKIPTVIPKVNPSVSKDSSVSKANRAKENNITTTSPKIHYSFGSTTFKESKELVYPTVGLGVGVLSFYGDIDNNILKSPLNGRIASDLNISQRISECFSVNFHALMGKLEANERFTSDNRNANFQSTIRGGGISLVYDFGNLLPKGRSATPFISLGIMSFDFLSKTDLKDKNGNTYYYWSDGTIRNIDQNAPNASKAVLLKRDYTYESDVRNTTLNKLGKYPEYSFAIPFGIGFSFRINNFVTFRVSSTMYYSFTDNIDGIVAKNPKRIIPGNNDNFMMSSCGLSYNFGYKPKVLIPEFEGFNNQNVDFYKINTGDRDKDGVPDVVDNCQKTPATTPIDTAGCPYDDDDDGIPNYKDKEINSPAGTIVSTKGVQLTDSMIYYMYDRYIDNTMKYAASQNMEFVKAVIEDKFVVRIGTYEKSDFMKLPATIVSDSASIIAVKTTETKSMYVTTPYDYESDAEKRKEQMISEGIAADSAKVMVKQGGTYLSLDATNITIPKDTMQAGKKENATELNNNGDVPKPEDEKPKGTIERRKFLFRSKQKSE